MRRISIIVLAALMPLLWQGCDTYPENPNKPLAYINFTIYPNSIQYQALNTVSGWEYFTSDPNSDSRGIIIYRMSETEFLAYDRIPPNYPDACTDSQGNTTRLVVDFPFVVDQCNNAYYNILNGQIIVAEPDMIPNFPTEGVTVFPLIQYRTTYDGSKLTVTN
jgi:hypothetical protein